MRLQEAQTFKDRNVEDNKYYDDDDSNADNDDSGAEDEEGVVKAWEGRQHPHASRPSAHPITHTEEKYERFS